MRLPARLLKRLLAGLALASLLGLAGCSALTLAYQQFPLLAGFWLDGYLDLDGPQRRQLKAELQALQAWHRREELPHWQALLQQAQAALDDGRVTRDELLALELGVRASGERMLRQMGPLAAPLLAELRPAQWQHLQDKLDEKADEWRERQAGPDGPDERARQYASALDRWLGDLDRQTRRLARADAQAWVLDVPALAQARSQRQARLVRALRAWSRRDLSTGTALLVQDLQPTPGEQGLRETVIASVTGLFDRATPEQLDRIRRHWADWAAQLRALQAG